MTASFLSIFSVYISTLSLLSIRAILSLRTWEKPQILSFLFRI